jgi:Ca-activated chloride channel family protein
VTFQWPVVLVALVVLPLGAVAYIVWDRRRWSAAARFASPHLLPNVVDRSPGPLRHLPPALFGVALAALVVGAARPHAARLVASEEATIVLALDRSRSMVAADVRPTRLVAAKAAALAFVAEVPKTFRIGIVGFATTAQVASVPTADRTVTRAAIEALRPGEGTALGEAIVRSLELGRGVRPGTRAPRSPSDPPLAVLLLSDGAQTQGQLQPVAAAQTARTLGVPIYTVALGTPDGVVSRRLPGGLTERIKVPPDRETLARIAEITGAESFAVADAPRLQAVYENLGSRLGRREERREITFAFAAGGAALLFAAGAASVLLLHRLP